MVNSRLTVLLTAAAAVAVCQAAAQASRTYAISRSGSDEILVFGRSGGLRFFDAQYTLYGDGCLVREVVSKAQRDVPFRTDEVRLSPAEVTELFDAIVSAGLPTVELDDLLPSGQTMLSFEDGRSFFLILNFAEYEIGAESVTDFSASVSIEEPELQAEEFPDVVELQAFLDVVSYLASRFETTDLEAIKSAGRLPGGTGQDR